MSELSGRRIDLHAHSAASFDGLIPPEELVLLAAKAGLTHLAITDHDRIDGALRARDAARGHLHVIVGEEIRTVLGDLIGLFLEQPISSGMDVAETSAAIREQGGLVGLAHPFDASRPSIGVGIHRAEDLETLARLVDYVEIHNGRVRDSLANSGAADFAHAHNLPGIAASDTHRAGEVGSAYMESTLEAIADAPSLLDALVSARLVVTHPNNVSSPRSFMDRLRGRGPQTTP